MGGGAIAPSPAPLVPTAIKSLYYCTVSVGVVCVLAVTLGHKDARLSCIVFALSNFYVKYLQLENHNASFNMRFGVKLTCASQMMSSSHRWYISS